MSQFIAPRAQIRALRKPRNPLVAPSLLRKAGPHGAGVKTQRHQQRKDIARALDALALIDHGP